MKRAAVVLAFVGLALGAGSAGAAATPHNLKLGVTDPVLTASDPALRDEWMARAVSARAGLVLLGVDWSRVAPARRPTGFVAADPADPAYRWETLDGAVRSAVAQGMQPLLAIDVAPAWAEGSNRPSLAVAPAGTWQPQPAELGRFAEALAARYSGRFVDPVNPAAGPLPRVRYFQIWAEENLSVHLNPLWEGGKLVAPQHYREMLNAAYAAIHRANSRARVIVGGLAPYGDAKAGGSRIPPVWFWRSLLCLRGARLRPLACPQPAHFDIGAHNPINVWAPSRGAVSPLDVSTPDIGRLTKIIKKAVASRRALPAKHKPFWATELWWDSNPPDPQGIPLGRHARFVAKSLFVLWRQGVSAVIWWYLRDQSPGTAGFPATQQSGLFFREGQPKPALRAFRFPFVASRGKHGQVLLWGKAPSPGRLIVERRRRRGWAPLAHPVASSGRIFLARVDAAGGLLLRARQGGERSLSWRVRRR
ncbi:MAG TPA: hypothetical protein VIE64_03295 [Solirubrobacterales bacterium]